MDRLKTTYLGLELSHPLVSSAGPQSRSLDRIRAMEDAGIAAIIMHSLFEEQITLEASYLDLTLNQGIESYAEATDYLPDLKSYHLGPDAYLEHIAAAKAAVNIPIIGSLNGVTATGWTEYARLIEEAGADALELNVYYIPTDVNMDGAAVEQLYVDLLQTVKSQIKIPIAMKLNPFFSSIPALAKRLADAGADGLALFNRFYQPDLDLEKLEIVPDLKLSNAEELRLRLRWTAILYGRVNCDLGITGGIHGATDVLKSMMAGANCAMMTSAILERGAPFIRQVVAGLLHWMDEHEYESVQQMRGSLSQKNCARPEEFERANYLQVLGSYTM